MSQTLSRRYECRTTATADLHMRAQKANLLHNPNLWLTVGLLLAVLVMGAANIVLRWQATGSLPVDGCALVLLALAFGVYRAVAIGRTVKRTGQRFRQANPEGSCVVTTWVQNDDLRTYSRHAQHTIPLCSVRRLVAHKDIVVLLTTDRKFLPFFRKGLDEGQWRGLCADIRKENPKFRTNLK